MAEIQITEDGGRALREAENFCWRTNVGIVAPEHLLAGALVVLGEAGIVGLPSREQLEAALREVQGSSEDALTQNVMFGSAAREALNMTARAVGAAGGSRIDARLVALGCIESGEVVSAFYGALGVARQALIEALG